MRKKKHSIDLSHLGKEAIYDIVGAIMSAKSALARKGFSVQVKKNREIVNKGRNKNCRAEG